jgi:hypothetical protein
MNVTWKRSESLDQRERLSRWLAAYLDGRFELQEDRLLEEYLAALGAKVSDLVFVQVDQLSRAVASHYGETGISALILSNYD